MTKRTIEMTTEQMQAILKGAPDGATHFNIEDGDHVFYKEERFRVSVWTGLWQPVFSDDFEMYKKHYLKLSDIRAELSSRLSAQAYFASDERGSIEQEQSVIEPTYTKCALLRDYSLEKLQWLINENLANGWNLVGAVVSAGIHNDTFVATMMKVAGDE